MTADMAFGHCVKLWFGDVSRQASIGPQAQSAAHASDVDAQLLTLHAVHAAPPPSPSVRREPSQTIAGAASEDVAVASDGAGSASDDAGAASDAPRDAPPDDELHP